MEPVKPSSIPTRHLKRDKWEVDCLLDRRLRPGGRFEYRVKWKNFPPSRATWEPLENLTGAPDVLADFERQFEIRQQIAIERAKRNGVEVDETLQPIGYDRGLAVKHVIAATDKTRNGVLVFLVQWEGCPIADYVLADDICEKDPLSVLKFYEKKMGWKDWGGVFTYNSNLKPDRVVGTETHRDGRTKIKLHQDGVRRAKLMVPLEIVREHYPQILLKYLNARCFPPKK